MSDNIKFLEKHATECSRVSDADTQRLCLNAAEEIARLRARVQELEAGGDVIKQRDKLLAMLEEVASYINQTYSDLIGHNGAEWLAAQYVDALLPKIKSTIASVRRYTAPQPAQEPVAWKPIATAPKDNKRALYLARLNEKGELVELDFNGSWEYWQESWEMSHINGYDWCSASGIEEPTHWAFQDEPIPTAPQPAQEPVARLHITETDEWPDIRVEVLDGEGLQPSMSPVSVYLHTPAQPAADVVKQPPTYHDLHITTPDIPRTSIFNMPYGVMVTCVRAGGWQIWNRQGENEELLAGEYSGKGLILDVAGHVIVDSINKADAAMEGGAA